MQRDGALPETYSLLKKKSARQKLAGYDTKAFQVSDLPLKSTFCTSTENALEGNRWEKEDGWSNGAKQHKNRFPT